MYGIDINAVISSLKQKGMQKIRYYSDENASELWFEFTRENLCGVIHALEEIEAGRHPELKNFEEEFQLLETEDEVFEYAVEYAIMGFDFDAWAIKHRKWAHYYMIAVAGIPR